MDINNEAYGLDLLSSIAAYESRHNTLPNANIRVIENVSLYNIDSSLVYNSQYLLGDSKLSLRYIKPIHKNKHKDTNRLTLANSNKSDRSCYNAINHTVSAYVKNNPGCKKEDILEHLSSDLDVKNFKNLYSLSLALGLKKNQLSEILYIAGFETKSILAFNLKIKELEVALQKIKAGGLEITSKKDLIQAVSEKLGLSLPKATAGNICSETGISSKTLRKHMKIYFGELWG